MVAKLETVQRIKIVVLTVLYAMCSFAFDLLQALERNQASGQKLSLIFLMAVAVFDVIFYYWTFLSLSILLKQLSTRARNRLALAKMTLYKQLWWILIVTGVFGASLIAAQVVIVADTTRSDSTWMVLWWLRFAMWDIGYFLILLSVAYLFRPMENNQRLVAFFFFLGFDQ